MTPESVRAGGIEMALYRLPGPSEGGAPLLVWAHGWGQSHESLLPLAQAVRRLGDAALLDLPGFGRSAMPAGAWSTADYADAIAEWLAAQPAARHIWVGHSFGCRVGLQLAARHPELVMALFLVAAPGLPPQRPPLVRARLAARRWAFRLARALTPEGPARERLRRRFGSPDYLQATPLMRSVLVKAVNENLGPVAREVRCPTLLVYGDRDRDTPPDIGARLCGMMARARLVVLRGFGHLDVLTEGRHQLVQLLTEFVEEIR